MRLLRVNTFWVAFLLALFLMSEGVAANQETQAPQPSGAKTEETLAIPDLADLIPSATQLSSRLTILEKELEGGLDLSAVEGSFSEIVANLEDHSGQLQRLKASKDYQYSQVIELKAAILSEGNSLEALSKPLSEAIRDLGTSRKEWLDEKGKWSEWQSLLLKDEPLDEVRSIFEKAQKTIERALSLILKRLSPMLAVQQKAANIEVRTESLAAEIDELLVTIRGSVLVESSPPMLSSRYFSQFGGRLRYEVEKGLDDVTWPGASFFARQGWVVLFQLLLSLALIILIFRHRHQLKSSKQWCFIAKRPLSAGLFVGFMTFAAFYEGAPATWTLAVTVVLGISFARLFGGLIEASWKRQLVYGLVIFLITTWFLNAVGLPLPLFRLYILLAALAGLSLCTWWVVVARRHGHSLLSLWGLRLGALFFVVVLTLELWGKAGLAEYLFMSSVRTVLIVLAGWLLARLARGGLEWAFQSSPIQRVTLLQRNTVAMVGRLTRMVEILMGVLVASFLLMIWRAYDSPVAATKGVLSLGFTLGSQRISIGLIIAAAGLVYGSFLISWAFQELLVEGVLTKRRAEAGIKISIARLVHYGLVSVGFFLALLALGFELTKLTIVLSALGIGIGFGLQAIVNNFICGLILLFERPIRAGDYIELGGQWAEIKRIGLRSTTVQTFDRADVIIPNADLVTNQVTNWTLTDRYVRLIIPVGVAYGSDVPLVLHTLMKCATANDKVVKTPEPQVLFRSFGESSLDFELRVWTADVDHRLALQSELHQEIDQSFRKAGIEIAFPQRDLHVRSVEGGPLSRVNQEEDLRSDQKGSLKKEE
jgi:small-conductance mechanosensitive channel